MTSFVANCTNTYKMDFMERFRLSQALSHIRGRLLDIGCGYNNLVRRYGNGVGVDVYPWPGVDVLIGDDSRLPFPDGVFDTVTIIAALNHIPDRDVLLNEVRRVLRREGHLILTMIGPITGWLAHIVFRQDERTRGKVKHGELRGMTVRQITRLLSSAGFEISVHKTFECGLNHLYVARKRDQERQYEVIHHHSCV